MSIKQAHSGYQATIINLLDELNYLVCAHGRGAQLTWGHVGDLSYVKEQLMELAALLKGETETR